MTTYGEVSLSKDQQEYQRMMELLSEPLKRLEDVVLRRERASMKRDQDEFEWLVYDSACDYEDNHRQIIELMLDLAKQKESPQAHTPDSIDHYPAVFHHLHNIVGVAHPYNAAEVVEALDYWMYERTLNRTNDYIYEHIGETINVCKYALIHLATCTTCGKENSVPAAAWQKASSATNAPRCPCGC